MEIHEKYIVNENGEKTAVVISIEEYNRIKEILAAIEEVDCIDINQNIAKALKDIEEGRVYSLESIFGDENDAASI